MSRGSPTPPVPTCSAHWEGASQGFICLDEGSAALTCGGFILRTAGPGAMSEDESSAPRVGFTRGAFGFVVPSFYQPGGSNVTVRYNPPRVNPTRGGTLVC